jgi:hypothetical protein
VAAGSFPPDITVDRGRRVRGFSGDQVTISGLRTYSFTSQEGNESWNHLVAFIPAGAHSYILYRRGATKSMTQIVAILKSSRDS